jgi:chromosomal replication initiator protein
MITTLVTHPRTFRTFVTGPQNALAYNAALTVARAPGTVYNPLLITGGPGLGKTHLLHAIAAYLVRRLNGAEPIVITGEAFAAAFDAHLRRGALFAFRQRYRRAGALLLDGVAVLAGHVAAAEELVQTLDAVQEAGRQIVVAEGQGSAALPDLPPRLRGRLRNSVVATLTMPDEAIRLGILRQMAASSPAPLGDDVLAVLARHVRDSVHDLEAAAAALATEMTWGMVITPARAAAVAHETTRRARQARGQAQVEAVLGAVCAYYGLDCPALLERNRAMVVAQARQVAMYLLREDGGLPATHVGHVLGRSHSTVLHGHSRVARALAAGDPLVKAVLTDIRRSVRQSRYA